MAEQEVHPVAGPEYVTVPRALRELHGSLYHMCAQTQYAVRRIAFLEEEAASQKVAGHWNLEEFEKWASDVARMDSLVGGLLKQVDVEIDRLPKCVMACRGMSRIHVDIAVIIEPECGWECYKLDEKHPVRIIVADIVKKAKGVAAGIFPSILLEDEAGIADWLGLRKLRTAMIELGSERIKHRDEKLEELRKYKEKKEAKEPAKKKRKTSS